jgi:L-lactate permease
VMDTNEDHEAAEQRRAEQRTRGWLERFSWTFPFAMLTFLLMLTNLFPGVIWAFRGGDDPVAQQAMNVYILSTVTSCKSFVLRFSWFIHPGTMVLYCAIATPFLVRFTSSEESQTLLELVDLNAGSMMSGSTTQIGEEIASPGEARLKRSNSLNKAAMRDLVQLSTQKQYGFWMRYRIVMKRALVDGLGEALPVTIAIASYASLARIMSGFGMTKILSSSLVNAATSHPASYGIIGVILGAIGAGLTGSTTTSNFLFGRLQVQTALDLGLVRGGPDRFGSIWSVCGLQILGSSAGEVIAPQNAIFSVIILRRKFSDGAVIRGVLPVTFFSWLIASMLIGLVAVGFAQPLY